VSAKKTKAGQNETTVWVASLAISSMTGGLGLSLAWMKIPNITV